MDQIIKNPTIQDLESLYQEAEDYKAQGYSPFHPVLQLWYINNPTQYKLAPTSWIKDPENLYWKAESLSKVSLTIVGID